MTAPYIVPLYHLELIREKDIPYKSVGTIAAAAEVFHSMLDSSPVEKLAVIHCNSGLQMIGAEIVAIGSLERVSAVPADLFRGALRNNASSIWMAHNHVDGNVQASLNDFLFTERALQASEILGIRVEDHLVIGPGNHYSIRNNSREMEQKLLQQERELIRKRLLGGSSPKDVIADILLGKRKVS